MAGLKREQKNCQLIDITQTLGYNRFVGSVCIDGIKFFLYPKDHGPLHAHGFIGRSEVKVQLLAGRFHAVRTKGATKSEITKIVRAANANKEKIVTMWEQMHK